MYSYNEKLKCLEEVWHVAKSNHIYIKDALKSKKGLLYELNNTSTLVAHNIDFLSISNRIEDVIIELWREKVGEDKCNNIEDKYLESEEHKTDSFCEYVIKNYKNWR